MELAEKIQSLRKERGLTQEQFAEMLFVSRTAVSKWENGRGAPGMESLQMISKVFGISLDELLCADELISVAENENRNNMARFAIRIDGVLNISAVLGLVLPLYKSEVEGMYYSVPLYSFGGRFAVFYWLIPLFIAACGIAQIILNKSELEKWAEALTNAGAILNVTAVFLLILSAQPYPAILFFTLLILKSLVIGRGK